MKNDRRTSSFSKVAMEGYALWNERKYKKAFMKFKEAADAKDKSVYNTVGYFYEKGFGVKRDLGMAFYWYRRSALAGDMVGAFNLGLEYKKRSNLARARFWIQRSIDLGLPDTDGELEKLSNVKKNFN